MADRRVRPPVFDETSDSDSDTSEISSADLTENKFIKTDLWSEWDLEEEPPKPLVPFTFSLVGFIKKPLREISKDITNGKSYKIKSEFATFPDRVFVSYSRLVSSLVKDIWMYLTHRDVQFVDIQLLRRIKYTFSPLRGYLHKRGTDGFRFNGSAFGNDHLSLKFYTSLRDTLNSSLRRKKSRSKALTSIW